MDLKIDKIKFRLMLESIFSFKNLMEIRVIFLLYNDISSSKIIQTIAKAYCLVVYCGVAYKLTFGNKYKVVPIVTGDILCCIQLTINTFRTIYEKDQYLFDFNSDADCISKISLAHVFCYSYIIIYIILKSISCVLYSQHCVSLYLLAAFIAVYSLVIFNVVPIFVFNIFRIELKSLKNQFIIDMKNSDRTHIRKNLESFVSNYRDLLNKLRPLRLLRFYVSTSITRRK